MNAPKILPDDPRLTAYALGELTGEEHAAFETALRDDPAARATVAEIRATTAQLAAALATEAAPALHAAPSSVMARAAIIPGGDPRKLDGGGTWGGNIFRLPRTALVLSSLAAACLVLVVTLREPPAAPVAAKTVAHRAAAPALAPVAVEKKAVADEAVAPSVTVDIGKDATTATAVATDSLVPKESGSLASLPLTLREQATAIANAGLAKAAEPVAINVPTPTKAELRAENTAAITPPALPLALPPVTVPQIAERDSRVATAQPPPAADNVVTLSEFSVKAKTAQASQPSNPLRRADILPPSKGLAMDSRGLDRMPISENRGLPGTLPTIDLDRVAPRYAPVAAGLADNRASERDNDFINVAQHPVSSFAIDTDTAGYTDVRNFLQKRQRPPREVVHIEEMLNFFPFRYSPPKDDVPFAASMEVADAPWMPSHRLVRIGLKAREVTATPRPPANLVFVLDVLTTDRLPAQLPMIRDSIEFLLGRLRADDRVALVSALGNGSLVLPPTPVSKSNEIIAALASFATTGSSNRAKALQLAYEIAHATFVAGGGNHVILCTDGNASVTITAEGQLARLIETQTKSGVTLTAFGFGMGIYRDSLIELLADYGKGNYGYIDSRRAGEKFLVEDVNGPSVTVAKDVAVEVEFNPAKVARYRLIGYENRVLRKEDFKGEVFDSDEIGAGHAVTALFEIETPPARPGANPEAVATAPDPNELLTMKVRFKKPGGALPRMLPFSLLDSRTRFVDASADFKFAAAVAGLGMILRDSPHKGTTTLTQVIEWAEASAGDDPGGYRSEFVELAREAEKIER